MRRLLWLLVLALTAASGFAQDAQTDTPIPEKYREEEFSPAARNLRRAEIILFGSIPLTVFLSLEVYDSYRFLRRRVTDGQWDLAYAPWPLRSATAAEYEKGESIGVLVAAVSLSALLAVADYAIGRARERRAEEAARDRR